MNKHPRADAAIADYDNFVFSGVRSEQFSHTLAAQAALACSHAACDPTLTLSARERYREFSRQFAAIL
jgi:hypothetical protein